MNDRQKKLIEKLGLKQTDFEPKDITDKERIEILEDAFAELCEVVFSND